MKNIIALLFISPWKRTLIFIVLLCIAHISSEQALYDSIIYGMKGKEAYEMLKDGYQMRSGWSIQRGDTLHLGTGTLPNKSYAFIYQSPISYFTVTSTDTYNKKYLLSNAGKYAIVKELLAYGTKKGGFTIIANVKVGELSRYWIEIDNAIEAKELNPPPKYQTRDTVQKNSQQTLSIADELKKWKDLLDAGAITQEEYDAQKKKLLEGNQ